MKINHILCFAFSITLAGCLSESSSSPTGNTGGSTAAGDTGSTANVSASSLSSIDETIVPSGFNWQMQESKAVTFELVSNFSELDGMPLNIAGPHYIEVFSINNRNKTDPVPFLKTMTNNQGEAEVLLTLVSSWKGITVKTTLADSVCINSFYKEQLTTKQSLGCDVVVESE